MISLAKEYRQAEKNTPLVGFPNATRTDRLTTVHLFRISPPILLRTGTLYIARRLLLTRSSLGSSRPRIQPMTLMFSSTQPFKSLSRKGLSQTQSPLAELRPFLIIKTQSLHHHSPAMWLVQHRRFVSYSLVTLLPLSSCLQSPSPSTPAAAGSTPAPTSAAPAIGNFGSCSVPQIEFGAGFDNRKETSFEPVDKSESRDCLRNVASR